MYKERNTDELRWTQAVPALLYGSEAWTAKQKAMARSRETEIIIIIIIIIIIAVIIKLTNVPNVVNIT
jgi:hypothetical protein